MGFERLMHFGGTDLVMGIKPGTGPHREDPAYTTNNVSSPKWFTIISCGSYSTIMVSMARREEHEPPNRQPNHSLSTMNNYSAFQNTEFDCCSVE